MSSIVKSLGLGEVKVCRDRSNGGLGIRIWAILMRH